MNKPPVFVPNLYNQNSLTVKDGKSSHQFECGDAYGGAGLLAFTDPDARDTHRISVHFKPTASALKSIGALSAQLRRDGGKGLVSWKFSVDRKALAFLGAGETYSEVFTLSVKDSAGHVAFQDIVVTLLGANDAPQICWKAGDVIHARLTETRGAPSPHAVLTAGGAFHFFDADKNDRHVVSAAFDARDSSGRSPLGALTLSKPSDGHFGGAVAWTYRVDAAKVEFLAQGQVYTETFRVTVADAHGGTARQDVSVRIVGTNDAPVLAHALADQTAIPGHAFRFVVPQGSFTDIDRADRLTLSAALSSGARLPGWLRFDARSGMFTGTPPAGSAGFFDIRVKATDPHRASASDIFRIRFTGAANTPAIIGDPPVASVTEDVHVSANGKLIAAGTLPIRDPDAGQAAFQTIVAPVGTPLGALTLAANGAYSYSVNNAAVQFLGAGQTQIDRFVVKSVDGTTKTLAFTVKGADELALSIDAVAGDGVLSFAEGHAASGVVVTGGVSGLAPGSTLSLQLTDGGFAKTYSATVSAGGTTWSATIPQSDAAVLANGAGVVSIFASDGLGHNSAAVQRGFTVSETTAPAFALATSDAVGANTTQSAAVTLIGRTDPGDLVTLLATGATTIASTDGSFSFNQVALPLGDTNVAVRASNTSGAVVSQLTVHRLAPDATPDMAIQWNRIAQQVVAADAANPEFASRALAIESLAVFDAVSAINGQSGYLTHHKAPSGADVRAATAQAAHDALAALFPAQRTALDALLAQSLSAVADGQSKIEGVALGATIASEIVALRAHDGWNTLVIDDGNPQPGKWRATGPSFLPAQNPQWAGVTPFALLSPDQFQPAAPPALSSQAYADAVNEVKALGAANSSTRTADQTIIAKFWNDGVGTFTPPGQWNAIADQTALAAGGSLSANARLLAELNVAEADSAIACWSAKYTYDFWRPVSAIQLADQAGDAGVQQDANWRPLLITPNFPSYVSGHSTFSAAAADILTSVFGAGYSFSYTDSTLGSLPGATRSYASFWEAAQEAGLSRVYGGIHYSFDNTAGLTLGAQVGDWTLSVFDTSVDKTPPTISLDGVGGGVANHAPVVSGHVIDSLSGVAQLLAWLDDRPAQAAAFDAATGAFSFAPAVSADGAHSLRFTALDAAGNPSISSTVGFTVDTQAPTLALAAASVQPGATLTPGAHLSGTAVDAGSALTALSYAFDGGAAVPLAFDSTGAFDAALNYGALAPGAHRLVISARDGAGNVGSQTLTLTVAAPPPLTLTGLSPADMAMEIGVTFRPRVTFSRAVDVSTLTGDALYATDSTGARIAATVTPFADGTGAWLLFSQPLPGASAVTLHVEGAKIADSHGVHLDAAGAGVAGSAFTESFTTVSTAFVPGTTISGLVVDPGPDLTPMTPDDVKAGPNGLYDFANDTWKLPLVHARVFILGHEDKAVFTDANGRFTLTDAPTGDVKVEIDGTTATNAPPGYYFPVMVMDVQIQPGIDNTLMGGMGSAIKRDATAANPAVYLPRLQTAILTPLSATQATIITAPLSSTGATSLNLTPEQASQIKLVVQPGSLVDENGNPVANARVGISTVPSALVMDMLPPGVLQHAFDITIQSPSGAVFTTPAQLTLPNVQGLAPGAKTYVLSFDHTTGRLVIDGTATVSADGLSVVTDPGSGILQPGWHDIVEGTQGEGSVWRNCGLSGDQLTSADQNKSLADQAQQSLDDANIYNTTLNAAGIDTGLGGDVTTLNGLKNDAHSVAQDLQELGNVYNTSNDVLGYAAYGLKTVEDSAKVFLDGVGFLAGKIPLVGKLEGKIANGLNLLIGAADAAGEASTKDPLEEFNRHRDELQAQYSGVKPSPKWSPPPQPKFPAAVAHYNEVAARAQIAFQQIGQEALTIKGVAQPLQADVAHIDAKQRYAGLGAAGFADFAAKMQTLCDTFDSLPPPPDLQAVVEDLIAAITQMDEAFTEDTGMLATTMVVNGDGGANPPRIDDVAEEDIPHTLYAAIKNLADGDVQRTQFAEDHGLSYFFAAETWYRVSVYDPVTKEAADVVFQSGASGSPTHIPDLMLHKDDSAAYANGLTLFASYVVGVLPDISNAATAPPTHPDNLIPGISDQQALTQGLVGSARSALATGVVASVDLSGEAKAVALATSGTSGGRTMAYVATGSYGLAVVDVSNARNPVTMSQLRLTGGGAVGVAVDATLGVAAVAQGAGGVALIDVSDPINPHLLRTLADATTPDVAIRDGHLFTLTNSGQMQTYDLATGNVLQAQATGFGNLAALTLDGATLYTLSASGTLATWDVSSGTAVYEGRLDLRFGANPALISTTGNHLFAANGLVYIGSGGGASNDVGGYITVNVADPAHPQLIAGYSALGVAGAAIALNGSGLGIGVQHIQDVTQPGQRGDVLDVFNAADPANTGAFVTRFRLPGAPGDVEIANGQAFVADGAAGLQIVTFKALDTGGVAPTVAIVGLPASVDPQAAGLALYEGQSFTLGVRVTDDVQVARVELLVNGQVVRSDLSYPWTLGGVLPAILANGSTSVTLSVRATDTGGNAAVSAPVLVTLTPNPTAFTLTSVSPGDGTQVQLGQHVIALSFSRPVDPATISAADFTLTNALGVTLTPQSLAVQGDGRRVTLIYDSAALSVGAYNLVIDAAAIHDTVGVALGSSAIHSVFAVSGSYSTSWTAVVSGDWSIAQNWSAAAVPGAADKALMNIAGGTNATFRSSYVPGAPPYGVGSLTVGGLGVLAVSPYQSTNSFGTLVPNASPLSVAHDVVNSGNIAIAGGALSVGGTLHNSGLVTIDGINDSGVGSSLSFAAGATGRIEDGGRIVLAGKTAFSQVYANTDALRIDASVGPSTVENVDNVISGTGRIGAAAFTLVFDPVHQRYGSPSVFINDAGGTVHADGTDYILINSGTLKNHGLIEATGGANIDVTFFSGFANGNLISPSTLVTGSDGLFLADGANSGINLVGAYIDGGTFESRNGGEIALEKGVRLDPRARSPVVLDGTAAPVRLIGADSGTLGKVYVGDETLVKGALFNHSLITLANNGSLNAQGAFVLNNSGYLGLADDTAMTGQGEILLNRSRDAFTNHLDTGIVADNGSGGMTLDNVDNLIHGNGVIGSSSLIVNRSFGPATQRFALKNEAQGKIVADATQSPGDDPNAARLDLVNLDIVNRGRIESTGSGGLFISNAAIDNAGGIIAADTRLANYAILDSSSVVGGKVAADGGTMVIQATTVTGATYEASNGGSFQFYGANDATTDVFQSSAGLNFAVLTENASLDAGGNIGGLFEFDLYKNSTLTMSDPLDAGDVIAFKADNATAVLDVGPTPSFTLKDFHATDVIDLLNFDAASAVISGLVGDDLAPQIDVTDAFGDQVHLEFIYSAASGLIADPTNVFFSLADDGHGGVRLTNNAGASGGVTTPGEIVNAAALAIGPGLQPDIAINQDTRLTGGGRVSLQGGAIRTDGGVPTSAPVTFFNHDNTIYAGVGQIGTLGDASMLLDNEGFPDLNGNASAILSSGELTIAAAGTHNEGEIVAAGGSIHVLNDIDNFFGQGGISAQGGGSIRIDGQLHGDSQNETIYADSVIEAGYVQDGRMNFLGANATFIIDHITSPGFAGGDIASFYASDQLDLRDLLGASALLSYAGDATGGTLTIADGVHSVGVSFLGDYTAPSGSPSAAHFSVTQDAFGGATITTDIARV